MLYYSVLSTAVKPAKLTTVAIVAFLQESGRRTIKGRFTTRRVVSNTFFGLAYQNVVISIDQYDTMTTTK